MPDENNPLDSIQAMESYAFRVGQVARHLLAEHADLPVQELRGHAHGSRATLEIWAGDVAVVHTWAQRLSAKAETSFTGGSESGGYEHVSVSTQIDGVDVEIFSLRTIQSDEWEAVQARQAEEAAEGGERS